jgi:hypothetical protein
MDDPEAKVKSSLSDCTWLEDLSMDLSSRHMRTYEAKRTEEQLCYFLLLFLFSFCSLPFFSSSFFPYFSFLLIIIFFIFNFSLAPQNVCNIVLTLQLSEMM